jgi:[acyl-carrier-protein] S-malonyltransferase
MFARAAAVDPELAASAQADFARLAGRPFDGSFSSNADVQLAVHLVTRVYRLALIRAGVEAVASAGLSLGEYAHLAHIGALTEDAADALIAARGRRYDDGPHGRMVAVTPGAADEVEAVLATVRRTHGIPVADLAISNDNSPRQVVVAGRDDAIDLAVAAIEEELFAMTTEIERRVPMHVGRFAPVAEAFTEDLATVAWQPPSATWWSNVEGGPVDAPTPEAFVAGMTAHVVRPVRWRQLVDALLARHPGAVVLEVGPGRILTGMLARGRWHPEATAMSLDDPKRGIDWSTRLEEVRRVCA